MGGGDGLFSAEEWDYIALRFDLPPRQVEIIHWFIADPDCKPQAIALRLGIETWTVKTHIKRLYKQMGVRGRCGVLKKVFEAVREHQASRFAESCT